MARGDVKEYYFYLDSTPTHSYMKYLYKYPQAAYPYDSVGATNRHRTRREPEYELLDTGVFDDDRYFDVFVEYAKATPEDVLIKIRMCNRGPEPATLHLLPTLWFRNTWSWRKDAVKPSLRLVKDSGTAKAVRASHPELGDILWYCEGSPTLLFTENETNNERPFLSPNRCPFVKNAFHRYLIEGQSGAINPDGEGTKAAAHYALTVSPAPRCLIGMEACAGARFWARKLTELGHTVKLIAPQFVKPYVKTNKNDAADAEAICEAVGRPNMRFIPIKNTEQQALLGLHRARQSFVIARTAPPIAQVFFKVMASQVRPGLTQPYNGTGPSTVRKSDQASTSLFHQGPRPSEVAHTGRMYGCDLFL